MDFSKTFAQWAEESAVAAIESSPQLEAEKRIADLFADYSAESVAAEQRPLADLDDAQWLPSRMAEVEPPPMEWIIDGVLPVGIGGLLVAEGGMGKTMLELQLGISIASGITLFPEALPVMQPRGVLLLLAEDPPQMLWRRFHAMHVNLITAHNEQVSRDGIGQPINMDKLDSNLYIRSLVGEDAVVTMIDPETKAALPAANADRLRALLEQAKNRGVDVVFLDPLSHYRGGDENSADHASAYTRIVAGLCDELKMTIITAHHTNKTSSRHGDSNQAAARGSSALVDNSRWMIHLRAMSEEECEEHDVNTDDAHAYVRVTQPKNSYGAVFRPFWLKRDSGTGLLWTLPREPTKEEIKMDPTKVKGASRLFEVIKFEREKGRYHTLSGAARNLHKTVRVGGLTKKGIERAGRALLLAGWLELDHSCPQVSDSQNKAGVLTPTR